MKRINWYIATTVAGAIFVALLIILSLNIIASMIDEMGDLKGGYTFIDAVIYVTYTIPGRLYEQIPLSALLGCLFGLGSLASSSELVVIRAAGVSVIRITWAVMQPVLVFIMLGLLLGEYATPLTDQLADSHRALAQGKVKGIQSQQGVWSREADEFIHINAVHPDGVLYGVTRYAFSEQGNMTSSSFIEKVTYEGMVGKSQHQWQETSVIVTEFGKERLQSRQFPTRNWLTQLSPTLLNVLILKPDALSIRSLYSYASYLSHQNIESGEYWLAFWKKVLQPLAVMSLVLVAISFIFGPLRQVTMGFRIFIGVVVGIVFDTSQQLLGPSSLVFGFPPILAVLVPITICTFIGVMLLRRC